jgi:hypothetical protein
MQKIIREIPGWLICAKKTSNLPQKPMFLFSESDEVYIKGKEPKNLTKEYDIIYNSGSKIEFHKYHKNWDLAVKCFKKIIQEMPSIKILIIGRTANESDNI